MQSNIPKEKLSAHSPLDYITHNPLHPSHCLITTAPDAHLQTLYRLFRYIHYLSDVICLCVMCVWFRAHLCVFIILDCIKVFYWIIFVSRASFCTHRYTNSIIMMYIICVHVTCKTCEKVELLAVRLISQSEGM